MIGERQGRFMEQIKTIAEPLIELLPPDLQEYWWAIGGVLVLMVLLLVVGVVSRLVRAVFRGRPRPIELDLGPRENLADYPLPAEPWGKRRLTVEGVPVRIRLVVVAPMGNKAPIAEAAVEELLDRVLWGLGSIAKLDRPQVRSWPPQLSSQGFVASFSRRVHRPEP